MGVPVSQGRGAVGGLVFCVVCGAAARVASFSPFLLRLGGFPAASSPFVPLLVDQRLELLLPRPPTPPPPSSRTDKRTFTATNRLLHAPIFGAEHGSGGANRDAPRADGANLPPTCPPGGKSSPTGGFDPHPVRCECGRWRKGRFHA